MLVEDTAIAGVKVIHPDFHRDGRGYFVETYNRERYFAAGITANFVQDNESFSSKGVVRGLHWQAGSKAQAKLVRVVRGAVWDIAVDIRKGSPTYGKYAAETLTAENGKQFYIPRGFAHGFIVLEEGTLFSYKCDNLYCKEAERGLRFDDPALKIAWPETDAPVKLSEKDLKHPFLDAIEPWTEE